MLTTLSLSKGSEAISPPLRSDEIAAYSAEVAYGYEGWIVVRPCLDGLLAMTGEG